MSSSRDERRVRSFVVVAVVAAVLLAVTYLVFVRTSWGQRFDDIAFDARGVEDPEVTKTTNELLHSVTSSTLVILTAAIMVFALARGRVRLALTAGAAITVSVATTEVLKSYLLERPNLDEVAGIAENSFPSGHATIGMALSLGLVMVAPHRSRWLAAVIGVMVSMVFGVGVLATGWHRPSDTIAAYFVCVVVFGLATAGLLRWRGGGDVDQRAMGKIEEKLSPAVAASAALLAVGAAVVALVLTFQEDSLRTVEFAADYLVVCVVILLLASVIVVGYHELLRGISLDPPRASHAEAGPSADGVVPDRVASDS